MSDSIICSTPNTNVPDDVERVCMEDSETIEGDAAQNLCDFVLYPPDEPSICLTKVLRGMFGLIECDIPARYSCDEIGFGYIFADCYRYVARYIPERKKWYIYSNGIWQPNNESIQELCKELAAVIVESVQSILGLRLSKTEKALLSRWTTRSGRESIIKDASTVYPISMSEFDRDPYILNCKNGTLNLRDMAFHDHNPDDLLTKMANVEYDPTKRCDRWERFIREIMLDDTEKMLYLQKALGYALSGITKEECMFLLYGVTTRNGKSTTMDTTFEVLGDYGRSADAGTIAEQNVTNSRGPSEDLARLAGARFINISEPKQSLTLDVALVKAMTGNDELVARYLNENSFSFKLQGKIFVNTNHLPRVNDSTLFSSGRVKVILFEKHFEEHEQDKNLKDEFKRPENLSGILNWFIDGWKLYAATGLDEPQSVKDATEEFRQDSDKLGLFMSEMMVSDPDGLITTTDAYNEYRDWCYANGYAVENMSSFKAKMKSHATVKRKRAPHAGRSASPRWYICGYKFLAPVNIPLSGDDSPDESDQPI